MYDWKLVFFPTPKTPLMMTLNQLIPYLKRGSRNRKKNIFLRLRRLRRCLIVIVLTIFHLQWVLTLFTIAIAIFTLRSEAKR